jgi:hypothetical protein
MAQLLYRYEFTAETPAEEIEAALLLALVATEALHGEAQTRLDAGHAVNLERRTLVIDASTAVGHDLTKLFTGFVSGEFGEGAFRVERVQAEAVEAAAAR